MKRTLAITSYIIGCSVILAITSVTMTGEIKAFLYVAIAIAFHLMSKEPRHSRTRHSLQARKAMR